MLCALAPTIEVLVAGRALQGIAGALLTPAALAVIVATFSEAERGRAVGTWTAWGGIGTVLGPLIGGQLVDTSSWRLIFAINLPLVVGTIWLIMRVVPGREEGTRRGTVDVLGATLCALGLAGMTFGLIEQPLHGWSDPAVFLPLVLGAALFASFLLWEARAPAPMLPLALFRRRNFSAGNVETFAMYGGLGLLFFFLVLYLQQVAGYDALEAGVTGLPVTIVMFLLSSRFGALADRYGPRFFMGVGPLVSAAGLLLILLRVDASVNYWTDLLPGLLLFALGLSVTVAPLTATVLADADEHNAGIASGVNNAIARVAGLVAIAAVGAVVAAQFAARLDDQLGRLVSRPGLSQQIESAKREPLAKVEVRGQPPAVAHRVDAAAEGAATSAFHLGVGIAAVLVALGGVLGLVGIRNPRRKVEAEGCPGGQLVGVPDEGARQSPCEWGKVRKELPAKVPRPVESG